jgi:hypothetical protein
VSKRAFILNEKTMNGCEITEGEVMKLISDFERHLILLCEKFKVNVSEEEVRICKIEGVDRLLSMETKVNYLCNYFGELYKKIVVDHDIMN